MTNKTNDAMSSLNMHEKMVLEQQRKIQRQLETGRLIEMVKGARNITKLLGMLGFRQLISDNSAWNGKASYGKGLRDCKEFTERFLAKEAKSNSDPIP